MKVLIVGVANGKGSLEMRAYQLGRAIGARVTTEPTSTDWRWADLIVLVKRAYVKWAAPAQATKKPIVWDALDCWRQPAENKVSEVQAVALLRRQMQQIKPALTLCATEAQARACKGVYVPHHSWQGLTPTPARDVVSTVAYEGNPAYLGQWHKILTTACQARGWTFVVNPPDLRQADILVALREGIWDGWICREWKSGVKLVNAIAAGRPIIVQDSAAYREIGTPGLSVETADQLSAELNYWSACAERQSYVEQCRAQCERYTLATISAQYMNILQSVGAPCAA